jgi:hypothetical protein
MKPIHFFFLLTVACASSAFAQDFELDLSEEKAPEVPPELRPSLTLLSVIALDADEVTKARAQLVESEVTKSLLQSDIFGTFTEPGVAAKELGEKTDELSSCSTYSCFETSCKKLRAHRAFRLTVSKQGVGSIVQFLGYDPSLSALLTQEFDSQEKSEKTFIGIAGKSQAQKDKEFAKKAVAFINLNLKKLATPNGKINVDNVDQSAQVFIDGVEAGVGSFELVAQRGRHEVKVIAEGYNNFETSTSVDPLTTASVKISLVAKAIERAVAVKPAQAVGTPIYARPGLYVAIAGAIVAAIGIGVGQSAKSVEGKINAGGNPVPVTRAEAKAAQTNATLANVLVGAGGALVAGGLIWVLVTPVPAAEATTGAEPSTQTGVSLQVGGSF